jgi:hypothetical protein
MSLQHEIGGVDDGGFGCDGDDRAGHDLVGAHGCLHGWRMNSVEIDYARRNGLI